MSSIAPAHSESCKDTRWYRRLGLGGAILFLAIATRSNLLAQFQQPTAEELKMTSDPKAPGAAAVYLNVEEATDDDYHFHSISVRIKVLQEKGKELATVELPYVKNETSSADTKSPFTVGGGTRIDAIKGRTIHADGTVIALNGKPDDLIQFKSASKDGELQVNRKVFTLPSVEVGSILEYSYVIRYDDFGISSPFWEIQKPYFVHKAHYSFKPAQEFLHGLSNYFLDEHGDPINSLIYWQVLPQGASVVRDKFGNFSLDVSDVPPMPDEEWMPPVQNFRYKVLFYYKAAESIKDFWATELKRWSKEVDRFAEPTKPVREAVAGLIAPTDSDQDKARKLYKAVQALDNTDFSRAKGTAELKQLNLKQTRRAEDTWAQKSGSGEEIALLYLAMVRAAGFKASAMKVADRERDIFDPSYLELSQLEDTIVIVNLGGKDVLLDPGQKMCPFMSMHWRHSNATGFVQGSDGKTPKNTPGQSYRDNNTTRKADLILDAQGGVQGSLRIAMIGQQALYWRQFALQNDENEVKKSFDRWLQTMVPEGVEAHVDHFVGLDNPDLNLVAVIKARGGLGTTTGKRVLLPAFFFETRARHPFVDEEKRQEPVDLHYSEVVNDVVVYRLPQGLSMESAPQDATIEWPAHETLSASAVQAPGQITISRSLARAFTIVLKNDYQDLRGFYQKVAASDQQQLVLSATPEVKGNE